MRRYQYDQKACGGWKSYPIRITLDALSECCQQPKVLVQSMSGGFITSNCLGCGKPYRDVTWEKFKSLPLIVSCPKCKKRMIPSMTKREGNYAYECGDCELYIWVSDILPDWKDLK